MLYSLFTAVGFFFIKIKAGVKNFGNFLKNACKNSFSAIKYFFKVASPYFKAFKSKAFLIWCVVAVALVVTGLVLLGKTMHFYEIDFGNDCIGYSRSETALQTIVESLEKQFSADKDISAELEKFSCKQVQTSNLFLSTLSEAELKNAVVNSCDTISFASCIYIDNERKFCAYGDKNINNVIENFRKDKVKFTKEIKNPQSCEFTWLKNLEIRNECVAVKDITTKELYHTLYGIFEAELPYRITCTQTEQVEIPYMTSYSRNKNLDIGDRIIKQKGVNGIKELSKRIVVENGKVTENKTLNQKVIKNATTQKVQLGNGYFGKLDSHSGLFLPVEGNLVSGFGMRSDPFTHKPAMHTGLDFSAKTGTEIMAAVDGKVVKASDTHNGYGNCVIIEHYDGFKTLYGHASKLLVKVGDYVNAGDVIALVGSTGRSTGPHLHFSIIIDGVYTDPSVYF